MKTRTTLLLALVASSIFAYLWFVDRHEQSTREAAESSAKVASIERDKVESLLLRNGTTVIDLRKKEGVWQMEHPLQDRADPSAIDRLLGLVDGLRHDAKIDLPKGKEQELLKEFGLADSETTLKLKTSSGKETELILGKDSAIAGKLYIRLLGQETAFVIQNELRARITAGPDAFRDHKLSATPVSSIQKFTIKNGEGEIALERKGSHWDLVKPLRARAATSKVNDLLAGMLTAQISQFLPDSPSLEQGLAEPRATLTATVEGQKDPLVLHIGAAPSGDENKERSFAKITERAAVTVLPNFALDPLLKAIPNDLRDKKLVRVDADIVDRITLERQGQPPLVLMRKGEGWNYKEGENILQVREGLASKILSNLLSAESVQFVADLATDLAQFGLSEPQLRVRLSSFASENTAESKSGENPIVTLLFGKVEGERCYVKLEDEPFIVSVEKGLLESLPTESSVLLPSAPPEAVLELKTAEVTEIEVALKTEAPVRLEKKEGVWRAAAGDTKPEQAVIETLLEKLGTLHASRRMDAHASLSNALATPLVVLKLNTQPPALQGPITLTVGSPLKDGTFPASLSGKEGVFLLSAEDAAALQRKLLP